MPDTSVTLAALRVAVEYWLNPERAREPGYVDAMLDLQEILGGVGDRVDTPEPASIRVQSND